MKLSRADIDAIADAVIERLAKRFPLPRPRRRGACGRGDSAPQCDESAIYGSQACTCRDR